MFDDDSFVEPDSITIIPTKPEDVAAFIQEMLRRGWRMVKNEDPRFQSLTDASGHNDISIGPSDDDPKIMAISLMHYKH